MFSFTHSASVIGVDGKSISVEVDISSGLPQVNKWGYNTMIQGFNAYKIEV